MASLKNWLALIRYEHSIMVAIAILISEALASKFAGVPFSVFSNSALFPALGPALITAAAFALNDYFGYETDKTNKRTERPIVSGKISKNSALRFSFILYALGLLLSLFVNFACFSVAIVYSILSVAYDPVLKKKPFLGNMFIASSMSVSFLYGNFVVSSKLFDTTLFFILIAFVAGIGRELLITLRDVKGDKKIGAVTVPMLIGSEKTAKLSAVFFGIAILASWLPFLQNFHLFYFILIALNNILLLYSIFLVLRSQSLEVLKKCRNLTLRALMLGLVAFAALAF